MQPRLRTCLQLFLLAMIATLAVAQNTNSEAANTVPNLIDYSNLLKDSTGKTLNSIAGVTFLIYKEEQSGSPLWMETQNVLPDHTGHYSVQLGSNTSGGVPAGIFATGEARWLAVQVAGEPEQERTLLVAVPYAMKAQDAQTLGGLPASAFVLAGSNVSATAPSGSMATKSSATNSNPKTPPPSSGVTTNGGTVGSMPLFATATDIENSVITQKSNKIGIGTTNPGQALVVQWPSTSGSGVQSVVSNTSTSGASYAVLAAESSANGVTSELVTDGLGTGIMKTPSGYVGTFSNQPFGFITDNAERMRITNTGMVGIGTTTPDATLDVVGSGNFSNGVGINAGTADYGLLVSTSSTSTGIAILGLSSIPSTAETPVISGASLGTTGNGIGVSGSSRAVSGIGTYGQLGTLSGTGKTFFGVEGAGIFGDGGSGGAGEPFGVLGTVDDGEAGFFQNNSKTGYPTLEVIAAGNATLETLIAGGPTGVCDISTNGDLSCSGTKNAVVPIDGGKRSVALSAIESPVNWFEDAGSGRLTNGHAVVSLDPDFVQTVNSERDYKVFPVPNGDCKGLYITNKTATSFEVRELGGGTSSVAFDYRIMALRRNYENVRFDDRTEQVRRMERNRARVYGKRQTTASAAVPEHAAQ